MPRSKTYGGPGLTGQALRDTVFADGPMDDTWHNRGQFDPKTAPPPAPYDPLDPVFYAPQTQNLKAKLEDNSFIDGVPARASVGTYRAQNGKVLQAVANASRHEFSAGSPLGYLVEQASTNVALNYNANPDAGLTGLTLQGEATLSRVSDAAKLSAAGLDQICTDGNVLLVDNSGSAGSSILYIDGQAGATVRFACSAYVRGTGDVRLGVSNTLDNPITLTSDYVRGVGYGTVTVATDITRVNVSAGTVLYIILNQLELQSAATSPIVTNGAAVTRAQDLANWPIQSLFSATQGMMAMAIVLPRSLIELRPATDTDIQHLLTWAAPTEKWWVRAELKGGGARQLFMRGNTSASGTIDAIVDAPNMAAGLSIVAARWHAANGHLQIGFKQAGAWVWGTQETTYANFDDLGSELHTYGNTWTRNQYGLYVWNQDKGTSWLEAFFNGTA